MHVRRGQPISREEDAGVSLKQPGAAICDNAKNDGTYQADISNPSTGIGTGMPRPATDSWNPGVDSHRQTNRHASDERRYSYGEYHGETNAHDGPSAVRKSECATMIQWLVCSKGVPASVVAKEAVLAPAEGYIPELVIIAAMTVHMDWDRVYQQCGMLGDYDADMLYERLMELDMNTNNEQQLHQRGQRQNVRASRFEQECEQSQRQQERAYRDYERHHSQRHAQYWRQCQHQYMKQQDGFQHVDHEGSDNEGNWQLQEANNTRPFSMRTLQQRTPKSKGGRSKTRGSGRSRQRRMRHTKAIQQCSSMFMPEGHQPRQHRIPEEVLNELSSDSDTDMLPPEALAEMIYEMSTDIREKTLTWLRMVADETGNIKGNPVAAVLRNVPPARRHRQYEGMSKAQRKAARRLDRHIRSEIKSKVDRWYKAVTKAEEEADSNKGIPDKDDTPNTKASMSSISKSENFQVPTSGGQKEASSHGRHVSMVRSERARREHAATTTKQIRTRENATFDWSTMHAHDGNKPGSKNGLTAEGPHALDLGGHVADESDNTDDNESSNEQDVRLTMLEKQLLRENKITRDAKKALQKQAQKLLKEMCQQLPNTVIHSGKTPEMKKLTSTGRTLLATWRNKLTDFNVRVARYRRTHPYWVPRLSDFVRDDIWSILSENMLNKEDLTDGGPPNDDAVEDMLRGEGNYAKQREEKGKVQHAKPLRAFKQLKWTLKNTNIGGFEDYIAKWTKLKRTIPAVQMPSEEKLQKVLLKAVKPLELKERVTEKMEKCNQAGA